MGPFNRIMRLLEENKAVPPVIFLACVFGVLVGLFFYLDQLAESPLQFWLFIPDCPLFVGLFGAIIALRAFGVRNDVFEFVVSVGLMKYAAWTLFVLSFYAPYFFGYSMLMAAESAMLFVMHIGMFVGGFVKTFAKVSKSAILTSLAWFLFNDWIDYFGPAVHPALPPHESLVPALMFGVASTFFFTWLAVEISRRGWRIKVSGISD